MDVIYILYLVLIHNVFCISNTYFTVICILYIIWKLVQFYSQKRQVCISSNPLGTLEHNGRASVWVNWKARVRLFIRNNQTFSNFYITLKHYKRKYIEVDSKVARSLLQSNCISITLWKCNLYCVLAKVAKVIGKSNWITFKMYFVFRNWNTFSK